MQNEYREMCNFTTRKHEGQECERVISAMVNSYFLLQ